MEPDELIAQIRVAFAAVARPSSDNIVNHECDECDELREGLLGFPSAELPDTWFDWNWDQLPLLSAQALQYYFPAYLCFALRQPDSSAAEFVLYALNAESQDNYTKAQRQAICDFLAFQRRRLPAGDVFLDDIERAEQRWRVPA
jgi:hypothetical protein